jgi:hypothetical protein
MARIPSPRRPGTRADMSNIWKKIG